MRIVRPKIERMFPVYAKGDVLGLLPIFWVSREQRNEMLSDGSARSVSRGKALQLTDCLRPKVQDSLAMGPAVMERIADGSRDAKALQQAWLS